ncbi:adenylosuccinate synthase [Candidatus Peregrinibacteria bacterium]|nr:MAG: adenylosuccinate synthase [Candidatus Peregrinibacteria bacterium]
MGDEGKGKLVDILSSEYDLIARSAGGANAGHTICVEQGGETKKYVFHLLPSGILHEGKKCVIGHGTVIHLPTLLEEISTLKKQGIDPKNRIVISDRAHLIFEFHKQIDEIQENTKGIKKVGTTKRGIGPAYSDKAARIGIRVGDLKNFDLFAEKLRANAEWHMKTYGFEFDVEREINIHKDAFELIESMIQNVTETLYNDYHQGRTLLIEGAQGTHLDLDVGTYPYVTSSNTTSGGACTGLGFPPTKINSVVGIVKAYTTRVGGGPFPTELGDIEGQMLRDQGNEYGSTTGRPRRCGWLDMTVLNNAIAINGINCLNLTKLDVLTGLKTIKIGVRYRLNGAEVPFIPANLNEFENVEVEYEEFEGWEQDISKATTFSDLPIQCRRYVERIEALSGVPVNFIGVGVRRSEMIYR